LLGYSATLTADSIDWYHVNFTSEKATASSVLQAKNKPNNYYGAHKAKDRMVETAWCSNAHGGDIKGENIEFEIKPQLTNGVHFLPGFGKNVGLFRANNRISKAKITVTTTDGKKLDKIVEGHNDMCLDYREGCGGMDKEGNWQEDMGCVNKLKCEWESNFYLGLGWQFPRSLCITKVKVEILDVIKGKKYDDTCIAEVSFTQPLFQSEQSKKYYIAEQDACSSPSKSLEVRRHSHQALVFNNKMWVIGGELDTGKSNNVWSSPDGNAWTQETAAAAFSPRLYHRAVVFKNKMWVIGGYDDYMNNGIWSSSNGKKWDVVKSSQEIVSTSGPLAYFSRRSGHQALVFNNKMWVIGGYADKRKYKNDIWSSSDGMRWTKEITSAGFSGRSRHQALVFNNKMWVIGGGNDDKHKYKNDIWSSSDGVSWTQETASAAFSARSQHQSIVFKDKMWVIGGYGDNNEYKNDIWTSTDGKNWTQETASAAFSPRRSHKSFVFNNKMWIVGGDPLSDKSNDVWSSPDGKTWTQEKDY